MRAHKSVSTGWVDFGEGGFGRFGGFGGFWGVLRGFGGVLEGYGGFWRLGGFGGCRDFWRDLGVFWGNEVMGYFFEEG